MHPAADELGRVYQPALAIAATPGAFLAAIDGEASRPTQASGHAATAHAEYEAWRAPHDVPGNVDLWRIVMWLDERLPADAVLTNGAGNFATWVHRVFHYGGGRTQLAPYSGSMGYGVPSAIAAKLLASGTRRRLVERRWLLPHERAGAGDGGAVRTRHRVRRHRQRDVRHDPDASGTHYPGRVSGTDLVNPDFAALARAYGAQGETVARTAEFAPAFERALAAGRPALLHVKVDPQALTMHASLDELRAQALERKRAVEQATK